MLLNKKKILICLLLGLLPHLTPAQEIDIEQLILDTHAKVSDTTLTQIVLDSLMTELKDVSGISWYRGAFHQSPDSLIKVYHFYGESCGAYCNPVFTYVIGIWDEAESVYQFHQEEVGLDFQIDSIVSLGAAHLYLIFGTHSGRPRSVEGTWGSDVLLCSIESGYRQIWKFESTTSNLVELESPLSELSFDYPTKTIRYQYDWYDEQHDFKSYRVSGKWKFENGTFILVNEVRKYHD